MPTLSTRHSCRSLLLAAAVLLLPHPADAQESPSLRFRTRALELSVGGRLQTLLSTSSVSEVPYALAEIRRARLELAITVHPLVSARLQSEFAGSTPSLRDAYVQLQFTPGLQLQAGQAFRPFSLLAQTTSVLMPVVERGLVIRGLPLRGLEHYNLLTTLGYADRDVGLQLFGSPAGAPGNLFYALRLSNGPLQARTGDRSAFQLSARARLQPIERVNLGAAWSRRDFLDLREEGGAVLGLRTGHAWEVDLEYGSFAPGLHLLAEVAAGDADPFLGSRFGAAQLWLAYRTPRLSEAVAHLEPTLRVSYGEHDPLLIRGAGGTLLSPGINLYFDPLNRILLSYDLWRPSGENRRESSLKLMFQVAF